MFFDIPKNMKNRMEFLEQADTQDRNDGTSRLKRLRQIPPESGRFLALMAATAPDGDLIEIGTSAGYSALWISLACRANNRKLTTFEILPAKINLAKASFDQAEVTDVIKLVEGNAIDHLTQYTNIAFCFIDVEKELYQRCYDLVVPNMKRGGILIADNVISHAEELDDWLEHVGSDDRVDSIKIQIGKGLLLCRRT